MYVWLKNNASTVVKRACGVSASLCILFFSSFSLHAETPASLELAAIDSEHFDSFMVADNAKIPSSKKIFIEDTSVSFDNAWLKKFKSKTSPRYREKIKKTYSLMFKEHLTTSLEKAGWTVMHSAQEDAFTLTGHLKDLYITAPDTVNFTHDMVNSVGETSILLEVKGTDSEAFFTIEDRRNAGGIAGGLFETERALNYAFFSRLTQTWASNFVVYLDLSVNAVAQNSKV